MNSDLMKERSEYISKVIERRTLPGSERIIAGWQNLLSEMLARMSPYLIVGHLVTFQNMTEDEKHFFEAIHKSVVVPDGATGIFIPPSVLEGMMYPPGSGNLPPSRKPSEIGIILVCRKDDFRAIANAVFAVPPFTPAIDVYEEGRLIAGYVYKTIEECVEALTDVLATFFSRRAATG